MKINIETILHDKQRYPTVGDYWYDSNGVLQVRVSDLGNELYEKMVVIHELIEEALTKYQGITEEQISDFDLYYEKRRDQGLVPQNSEPGFDNNAPYLLHHTLATSTEMAMCAFAGVKWKEYEEAVEKL